MTRGIRASTAGTLKQEGDRIIHEVYEAALDPTGWDSIGRKLRSAFDATSFILVAQSRQQGRIGMFETNWSADQVGSYVGHYYDIDPWAETGLRRPPMIAMIGDECLPDRDFVKSEIYSDFARPSDIRHMAAIWGRLEDGTQCSLALHGSQRRGNFDAEHTKELEWLFPHILRSVKVSESLAAARRSQGICEAALNALATGIVVVDGNGSVVLANRTAEGFAAARDGFNLTSGLSDRAVWAPTSSDTQRLRLLITRAAPLSGATAVGGSMRLPSRTGTRGYVVTVTPLPQAMEGLRRDGRALALLLLTSLDDAPRLPEAQLCTLFGLTAAEAKLVVRLAQGQLRQDYAEEAGIAAFTVKTHLSRAFAKLGVHRESELIRLVLSLAHTNV